MPNIASKMAQHRANIGQHRPNLGQHRRNIGRPRPNIGSTWAQDVPNIDRMGSTWPNLRPRCAPDSSTKSQRERQVCEREREGERQRDKERETGPSPAHTQTQIGRRPAVRRKPHKSGRRPRARVLAGGLRLVTEGYIRSRPLPPTLLLDLAYTPARPPVDPRPNPVDRFICILRRMFKNIGFYSVLWPSASTTVA